MAAPVVEPTPADQARALKQQADYLEQSLAEIKQRLAELEEA
jgi:prefoldin subunit 5